MSGPLDETTRPRVTDPDEPRDGHPNQSLLVQVHEHLRADLVRAVEALDALTLSDDPPGAADVHDVRAFVQRLSSRQDRYSLGAFCAAYCRTVATHHAIEDMRVFPDLGAAEPALTPVLQRLASEHAVVHELLVAFDDSLVTLVRDGAGLDDVRAVAGRLSDVLTSHLAYEEEQLLGPLGRLPVAI